MTYDPLPPDRTDPLAGRDPYPRHEIDLMVPLDARRELLEEIVSTPGASSPTAPTRRALVAGGVAAALLLVLGGAWFATGGIGSGDDPTVASAPTSEGPDVAEASPGPSDPDQADKSDDRKPGDVRVDGVKIGRVISLRECRELRRGALELSIKELRELERRSDLRGKHTLAVVRKHHRIAFLGGKKVRWVVLDGRCQVLQQRGRD